jgi:hypothetical protein
MNNGTQWKDRGWMFAETLLRAGMFQEQAGKNKLQQQFILKTHHQTFTFYRNNSKYSHITYQIYVALHHIKNVHNLSSTLSLPSEGYNKSTFDHSEAT